MLRRRQTQTDHELRHHHETDSCDVFVRTEHVEPHLHGGLAEAVGRHQRVEAGVWTFALLDEQRAAVVGHDLVDVLVVLNFHLVVRFVRRSLVPGECGERTAADLCHNADVGALLDLHELLQFNGRSACSRKEGDYDTFLKFVSSPLKI